MGKGLAVIGTDTGVGKTVVSSVLIKALVVAKIQAGYYKPLLSGIDASKELCLSGDPAFVKHNSGVQQSVDDMVSYCFPWAVSPHLASERARREIEIDTIIQTYKGMLSQYAITIVEGCGGIAVPLDRKGTLYSHILKEMNIPCILVAKAGLGTLNHTYLTAEYARNQGIDIVGIVISGYTGNDPEEDNLTMLSSLTRLPIVGVLPYVDGLDTEAVVAGSSLEKWVQSFSVAEIRKWAK